MPLQSTDLIGAAKESDRPLAVKTSPGIVPVPGIVPMSVLFACTHNEVRSPMAEGLLKKLAGTRIFVDSCGVAPSKDPGPMMVEVMAELEINMRNHHPKGFDDLLDESFDLIISLSPPAQHRAVQMTEQLACDVEYWPILDPNMVEGSREMLMESYRDCLRSLKERIDRRFAGLHG